MAHAYLGICPFIITGDPLHSRAACTQPCNVNTHSRAHCSPGARLCEQWGHGCVNNGARLCASARLCRGSPVIIENHWYGTRVCILATTCGYGKYGHMKHKIVFIIHILPPHWHDTGSWNPSSCRTITYIFYVVNIMGADVLVTQGARVSATIIMTCRCQLDTLILVAFNIIHVFNIMCVN